MESAVAGRGAAGGLDDAVEAHAGARGLGVADGCAVGGCGGKTPDHSPVGSLQLVCRLKKVSHSGRRSEGHGEAGWIQPSLDNFQFAGCGIEVVGGSGRGEGKGGLGECDGGGERVVGETDCQLASPLAAACTKSSMCRVVLIGGGSSATGGRPEMKTERRWPRGGARCGLRGHPSPRRDSTRRLGRIARCRWIRSRDWRGDWDSLPGWGLRRG